MRLYAEELFVYDHHKTAHEALLSGKNFFFDMDECGATLCWKSFFPDKKLPLFLQITRDRDLWLWELKETKAISAALRNTKYTVYSLLKFLDDISNDSFEKFLDAGNILSAAEDYQVERQLDKVYWTTLPNSNEVIPTINSDHLVSETCHAMLEKFPSAPYVGMWVMENDNKIKWSLRSSDDRIDVSDIAKKHGGGGHRNASGFYWNI